MKRFVILLLSFFMCFSTSLADSIDLDSMTNEELLSLRTKIDQKIAIMDKGDVIYEKDGFQIKWLGFADGSSYFKLILLVTNPLDKSIFFNIEHVGFNGIMISCANSFSYEIPAELSFITSSCDLWLFNYEDLGIVGLTLEDISDITMKISIKEQAYSDELMSDTIKFAIK